LGDTHYGTTLRHEDGIGEAIEFIGTNKTETRAVFMGDAIEAIIVDDKRYDPDTLEEPIPLQQANHCIKDFYPIRKKFIAWLLGNHEAKLSKFGNVSKFIADGLDVPYGSYSAVISVYTTKDELQYRLYVAHGFGAVDSKLPAPDEREHSMLRSLKRQLFLKVGHCNVMAMGHSHKLLVKPPTPELYLCGEKYLKQQYTQPDNGDYIHPDLRYYVNTGSFYKLYQETSEASGYAERMGLNPNMLGFPIIHVRDGEIKNIEKRIL